MAQPERRALTVAQAVEIANIAIMRSRRALRLILPRGEDCDNSIGRVSGGARPRLDPPGRWSAGDGHRDRLDRTVTRRPRGPLTSRPRDSSGTLGHARRASPADSEELAYLPAPGSGLQAPADVDAELLAQELRIGCTLAMLLCLDPGHRMAYILGVIMGLDHRTAAEVLDVSPAAFRKRLQRARDGVEGLMAKRCGLFDPANPCRCHKRIPIAIELGRVDPRELVHATTVEQARRFPLVLDQIRRLDRAERAGALYRAHPEAYPKADLAGFVRRLFPDQ